MTYQQRNPYPPEHLANLLRIGAHLKKGGSLTQKMVEQIANAHPAIPYEYVHQKAQQVNALPASERAYALTREIVADDPQELAQATRLLDTFSTHYEREVQVDEVRDVTATISAKLDARAAKELRDRGVKPDAAKVIDKPVYRKSETRQEIERAMGLDRPKVIDRDAVADRLERSLDVLDSGDKSSLTETLSAAFDTHAINDAIESGHLPLDRE